MDYKGRRLRPIWQILVMLPLWLLYLPAKGYSDWMDRTW